MLYYNSELLPEHQKQAVFVSGEKKGDLSSQSFTFHVLQTDTDHPRLCWIFFFFWGMGGGLCGGGVLGFGDFFFFFNLLLAENS